MKKKYYLAYGSNLNVSQMLWRCPDAGPVGTAVLKDYRLRFRGSKTGSYLTIEPCPGSSVPVGVWKISKEDEKALDRYEGFPSFYRKDTLTVDVKGLLTGDVFSVNALVYIMVEGRPLGIPSRGYVDTCLRGYQAFGLDPKTLEDAIASSLSDRCSA